MSDPKRIDRRSLFDAFRRALESEAPKEASPKRGSFSIAAFYERREATASEPPPFPHVTLRAGLGAVDTTAVGAGPTAPEPPPPEAPPPKAPPRGGVA